MCSEDTTLHIIISQYMTLTLGGENLVVGMVMKMTTKYFNLMEKK